MPLGADISHSLSESVNKRGRQVSYVNVFTGYHSYVLTSDYFSR